MKLVEIRFVNEFSISFEKLGARGYIVSFPTTYCNKYLLALVLFRESEFNDIDNSVGNC